MPDEYALLYQRALKYLGRREHSAQELQKKLQEKTTDKILITRVINAVKAEKLQSDARFADAYMRMRLQRGYGPQRIQMELQQRGVALELIEEVLAVYLSQWQEQLHKVRRKKFGAVFPNDIQARAKQMRFLQYRGFSPAQIRMVFKDDAENDDNE